MQRKVLSLIVVIAAACGLGASAIGAEPTQVPIAVQDVRLRDQGLLVGRAVTNQGAARENVKVRLAFQGKTVAEATTNQNGLFAVKGLRGGVHVVESTGKRELVRLWTAEAAPDAAADGLVLAEGQIVRGQEGADGVGSFLADNLVGVGIISATAGTAIGVSASTGDADH